MTNFYWLIFLFGLLFQSRKFLNVDFVKFLQPVVFPLLSFYLLKKLGISENEKFFLIQKNLIIGIGLSFSISSLFALNEKNNKNVDFLIFIYYGIANFLVIIGNLFYIFIGLELLTVMGAIFVIIDSESKNYLQLKDVGLRYFITHCVSGLIFLTGMAMILSSTFPNLALASLTKDNFSIGHYLIVAALLINLAVPIFSSWLVQSYSSCRFSLSFIFFAVVTKLSIFFILIIAPHLQIQNYLRQDYLKILGFIAMIYGSIHLLIATNIRRFLCYAAISHNGIFLVLISQMNAISDFQNHFSNFILSSMLIQNLLLGIAFIVSHNSKSYFFIDLEKNIVRYKVLFLFIMFANYIFIGMPLSPSFEIKNLIAFNLESEWQQIFYAVTVINVVAHLFVLPFRIFGNNSVVLSKNFIPTVDYLRGLCVVTLIIVCMFYLNINNFLPTFYDFHKYLQFIIVSGFFFIIFRKMISRNQSVILDFDFIFKQIKTLLKMTIDFFMHKLFDVKNLMAMNIKSVLQSKVDFKMDSCKLTMAMMLFCASYVLIQCYF